MAARRRKSSAKRRKPAAQPSAHSGARARRKAVAEETTENKERFLEAFAELGFILSTCLATGIGRRTVYDWLDHDKEFAQRFEEIREDWRDMADEEIFRRAVVGWEEPQFGRVKKDKDGVVGHVRKKSDRLLELLAKANRPERYREHSRPLEPPEDKPLPRIVLMEPDDDKPDPGGDSGTGVPA